MIFYNVHPIQAIYYGLVFGLLLGLLGGIYAFKKYPLPPKRFHWWYTPSLYGTIGLSLFAFSWGMWTDNFNRKPLLIPALAAIAGICYIGISLKRMLKLSVQFRIVHLLQLTTLIAMVLCAAELFSPGPFGLFLVATTITGALGYNINLIIYNLQQKRKKRMPEDQQPKWQRVDFNEVAPVPCPCGFSSRAFMESDQTPLSIHQVQIKEDSKTHYHKTLTEIYYILECKPDAALELDGERIPVQQGQCYLFPPGVRHRAVGKMTILNIVHPKFDPNDEWFD